VKCIIVDYLKLQVSRSIARKHFRVCILLCFKS